MSAEFSANISALRREKGISQKNAAEALGVSQALLSHYEKGIRECSLEFVIKAAEYYGVSTDYLLGLTKAKQVSNELLSFDDLPSDSGVSPKTLIRCILALSSTAERNGDSARIFFDDYFSLCIKRYVSALRPEEKNSERLCDLMVDTISEENKPNLQKSSEPPEITLALKTVEQHSQMLINKRISQML